MSAAPIARQAMYENGSLSLATSGMLRPGGWVLTERLLSQCEIHAGSRVLDVGCGEGATTRYLLNKHAARAIGLDSSITLLRRGHDQDANLPLVRAPGTLFPLATGQLDAVLAECSLSAIADSTHFLADAWRVLGPGGRLAIADIYVRNPSGASLLRALPLTCGLRNALDQEALLQCIRKQGFKILLWEDHSETLRELSRQITSAHGSLGAFWIQSEPEVNPLDLAIAIGKAKLGYFLLVAQKPGVKGENIDG
jgi:arsenite methyltransferase